MCFLLSFFTVISVSSMCFAWSSGTVDTSNGYSEEASKSEKEGFKFLSVTGTRYAIRANGEDVGGSNKQDYWINHLSGGNKTSSTGERVIINNKEHQGQLFENQASSNSSYSGKYRHVIKWKQISGLVETDNMGLSGNDVQKLLDIVKYEAQANNDNYTLKQIEAIENGTAKLDIRVEILMYIAVLDRTKNNSRYYKWQRHVFKLSLYKR